MLELCFYGLPNAISGKCVIYLYKTLKNTEKKVKEIL